MRLLEEQKRMDQMVLEYQKLKEGQSANPSQASKNEAELDDFYLKWKQQEAEQQAKEAAMREARAQAHQAPPVMMEREPQMSEHEKIMKQKMAAKDYSLDMDPNGWIDPRANGLSSVALQAQGMHVPQRAAPPVQKYPMGVSITQDPAFMGARNGVPMSESAGSNRRSLRDIKQSKIEAQGQFEDQFQKPGSVAAQAQLDQLYFRSGEPTPVGQKVRKDKNYSSVERVFGLDGPNGVAQSSPGGKRQFTKFNGSSSTQNLLTGGYGVDKYEPAVAMKPYSKHLSGIPKPPQRA